MQQNDTHTSAVPDWNALPELLLLDELCAITRHSIKHAYNLLARKQFPIDPLPDIRPYRFPKKAVRNWVETGITTNKSLAALLRERRRNRRRKVA
jgi:predicted DNA-binding transcriptional regulator AlpA